jgi:hypothetical protein
LRFDVKSIVAVGIMNNSSFSAAAAFKKTPASQLLADLAGERNAHLRHSRRPAREISPRE